MTIEWGIVMTGLLGMFLLICSFFYSMLKVRRKNDCIFCGRKWSLDYSVIVGDKFICVKCLKRLDEMMEFFKTEDKLIIDKKEGIKNE